jgi:hypothetical protein
MTRTQRVSIGLLAVTVVLALAAARARGQAGAEVATIAAVIGGAELQRAGSAEWQLAAVGSPLFAGDRVRTRPASRMKIVFQDDSIVDVGPASELVIDAQEFNPTQRSYRSTLKLLGGKIRTLVSEYYGAPRARYEIETPTAVAGVRGTEFIVSYDAANEYTDVVGLANEVVVEGTLGVVGGSVRVGPQMATRVQKGRFPTAPRRVDSDVLRQYLEGLDIIGTGGKDSLGSTHAAVKGQLLAPSDNAQQVAAAAAKPAAGAAQGGLVVGPPDLPLAAQYSKDVATNNQPLKAFQAVPPGHTPSGNVKVGF